MSALVRGGEGPTATSRRRVKVVVVVSPDIRERGRVGAALRGVADRLEHYTTLGEVPVPADSVSAVIVMVAHSATMDDLLSIGRYRSLDEATALLWCMGFVGRSARRLASLAKAGVDDVLDIEHDNDRHRLRTTVDERLSHALGVALVKESVAVVNSQVREVCSWCLRNGYRNLKVTDVARHFDTVPEVLNRTLHRQGVPSLKYLVRASRLLRVAEELELRSSSAVAIAHALDFSTLKNLSMFVSRAAHMPLRKLVMLGPLDVARACAMEIFGRTSATLLGHSVR